MQFEPSKTDDFLKMFSEIRDKISGFEGCTHLELYKDSSNDAVYFTYSIWESVEHLDRYRFSDLFKTTWEKTKKMFNGKPEAWSLERVRF